MAVWPMWLNGYALKSGTAKAKNNFKDVLHPTSTLHDDLPHLLSCLPMNHEELKTRPFNFRIYSKFIYQYIKYILKSS